MAMAVCWNCGARVASPTCQMCGAAQQPGGPQGQPAYAPGGQPVVNQASMSMRPPQPAAGNHYAPGGQYPYPPANQAGGWQAQPPQPSQAGWQGQQQQSGYQQPGYQQPSAYQQQQAAMGMGTGFSSAGGAQAASLVAVLPMALVGGVIAAVVGALVWAYIGHYANTLIGFLLGAVVGLGVWLGARGYRHIALAGLAAVLGLFSLFLGLYFLVSLDYADAIGSGSANIFALPIDLFFSHLGDFFSAEPYLYLLLVVVPLLAGATTYRRRRRW